MAANTIFLIDHFHCFKQSIAITIAPVGSQQYRFISRYYFTIETNVAHLIKVK